MKRDIKPLDIMTKEAFENGLTTVMALGGSTNAVLHLLAMSRAAGIPLDLEDFQRISNKTPYIADLRPSGKYMMNDLHKVSLFWAVQVISKRASVHLPDLAAAPAAAAPPPPCWHAHMKLLQHSRSTNACKLKQTARGRSAQM